MATNETGSLMIVLITGLCWFGVMGILATVHFVYASSFNDELAAGDTDGQRCRKKVRIARRIMAMLSAAAHLVLAVGYAFALFKVGTLTRTDGALVNWSYFMFVGIAYVFLACLHSVYFWLEGNMVRSALAAMWGLAMVLLATGPLSNVGVKRDLCFALSVILQGVSFAYIFWFEGPGGPLKRWRGWLVAGCVVVAFALYDIFWYIGYLNQFRSAVVLPARWKSHVPFLVADVLAITLSTMLAAYLYRPKKSSVATSPIRDAIESDYEMTEMTESDAASMALQQGFAPEI